MYKKADEKTFRNLVLVAFVIALAIFAMYRGWLPAPKLIPMLQACPVDKGAKCIDSTSSCMSISGDKEYVNSLQNCKDKKQTCCALKNPEVSTGNDAPCTGLSPGDACDKSNPAMVCTGEQGSLQCLPLCNYCAAQGSTPSDVSRCQVTSQDKTFLVNNSFSCSCTLNDCQKRPGTCVLKPNNKKIYCSNGNAEFCCIP